MGLTLVLTHQKKQVLVSVLGLEPWQLAHYSGFCGGGDEIADGITPVVHVQERRRLDTGHQFDRMVTWLE